MILSRELRKSASELPLVHDFDLILVMVVHYWLSSANRPKKAFVLDRQHIPESEGRSQSRPEYCEVRCSVSGHPPLG